MPITTAVIIAAIIVAFIVFGAVLAWADSQTRNLPRTENATKLGAKANVTRLQPREQKREQLNAA